MTMIPDQRTAGGAPVPEDLRQLAAQMVRRHRAQQQPCPPWCDGRENRSCFGDHHAMLPAVEGIADPGDGDGWIAVFACHGRGEVPTIELITEHGPEAGNGKAVRFTLDQAEEIAAQLVAAVVMVRGGVEAVAAAVAR